MRGLKSEKKRIKLLECRLHLLHSEFLGSSCHYPTFNDPFTRYAEMELESSASHESACCARSGPVDLRSREKAELGSLHLEVETDRSLGLTTRPSNLQRDPVSQNKVELLRNNAQGFFWAAHAHTHAYPHAHEHTHTHTRMHVHDLVK